MNINKFISQNQIKPADAILVRRLKFGLLKHYIIYLGFIEEEHRFMANYTKGIKLIGSSELTTFLSIYEPTELNRFVGNETARQLALNRAWSRRGEREYNLLVNNCEHYMNYVHHGASSSQQVKDFGAGLLIGGTAITLGGVASKNDNATVGGLVVAGLGLITLFLED